MSVESAMLPNIAQHLFNMKTYPANGELISELYQNSSDKNQNTAAAAIGISFSSFRSALKGNNVAVDTLKLISQYYGVEDWKDLILNTTHEPDTYHMGTYHRHKSGIDPSDTGVSREMLYCVPPNHLAILALRAQIRIIPCYDPWGDEGWSNLVMFVELAQVSFDSLLDDDSLAVTKDHIRDAYEVAVGSTPERFGQNYRMADTGFAVGVATARLLEGIYAMRESRRDDDIYFYRAVDQLGSSIHASGHAAISRGLKELQSKLKRNDYNALRL